MNIFLDEGFLHGSLPDAPLMMELEPTDTCNLSCKMCHVTYRPVEVRHILPRELIEKLDCIRGCYVALGSGFEPTIYPHIVPLLKKLSDLECDIEIITNGVALQGDVSRALNDTNVKIINLSFDGAKKSTYETIRAGSSYDVVLANIIGVKEAQANRSTFFAVNFTAMRSNIAEITDAVALWDGIGIDQLRVLGLVIRDYEPQLLNESLFPILSDFYKYLHDAATELVESRRRLALNSPHFFRVAHTSSALHASVKGSNVCSGHPETRLVPRNRQKIQTTTDKNGNVRCRSPYTFARVLFNGDVQLCYKFSVGNLRSNSLAEIWRGEKAKKVREMIENDQRHCESCDYFKYCLSSDRVDYDKLENHFSSAILPRISFQNDKKISFEEVLHNDQPRLVTSVGNLNIVHFKSQYLVVPQSLGEMDLSKLDIHSIEGITIAANFRDARLIARAIAAKPRS